MSFARNFNGPKFNPQRCQAIVEAIGDGNFLHIAARANGISYKTLKVWVARGRSTKPEDAAYREFRRAVVQARVRAETDAVARIRAAMPKTWSAAAWFLEKSFPQRWGNRARIEARIGGLKSGPAVPVSVETTLPPEYVAEVIRILQAIEPRAEAGASSSPGQAEASTATATNGHA